MSRAGRCAPCRRRRRSSAPIGRARTSGLSRPAAPLALGAILDDAVRGAEPLAHARQITLPADVAPDLPIVNGDGRRFFFIQARERAPEVITQIHVVEHWFEELDRMAPIR